MKYFVRIGPVTREVEVDGDTITLDGKRMQARIEELESTPVRLVIIDGAVHRVVAQRGADRGQYDLWIDGYRVAIEALDERARTIRDLSAASRTTATPKHVLAPMPGLIVRVAVNEGDDVRAGQGVVVMEAMKMENELRAPAAGKVKRVVVQPGAAVEKGTLLVELE